MVADAFREAAPEGISEDRLQQAASATIAAMDGLQVQWLLKPEAVDMPAAVGAVIEGLVAWLNGTTEPVTTKRAPTRR